MKYFRTTSPAGTEYTFVFNISDTGGTPVAYCPFLITGGVRVNSFTYDSATQKMTLIVKTEDLNLPSGTVSLISLIFTSLAESVEYPPVAVAGAYIASTVSEFSLILPQPGMPEMGISLTGDPNTSTFFNMFVPAATLAYMSELSGKTIGVKDLAVFIDDKQASTNVTELNGGGFIDINITFSSGDTTTGAAFQNGEKVTKEIIAKQKLPLSFAAKKEIIKKNKTAEFYGWLEKGKKNQKIVILRKKKREKKYTQIATVKTKKSGHFYYKSKAKAKGTYYYKAVYKNKKSPVIKLKVL
ncbi:MAG: hypothetical protein AB1465_06405 [Patescibacteria group bacterium]